MYTETPAWTGRLEFGLDRGHGPVATVDVSVRIDIVTFWIGSRTLAVVDRDMLRQWVHHPSAPLAVDDLEFMLVASELCVRVDGTAPYPLPVAAVSHLLTFL